MDLKNKDYCPKCQRFTKSDYAGHVFLTEMCQHCHTDRKTMEVSNFLPADKALHLGIRMREQWLNESVWWLFRPIARMIANARGSFMIRSNDRGIVVKNISNSKVVINGEDYSSRN